MKQGHFFILFLLLVIANITNCMAQVTIGANSVPNATLDVRSQSNSLTSHDGIIAPKLTGNQLANKDASAYAADQDGAVVYVTAAASEEYLTGKTVNITSPGFYYYCFTENVWIELGKGKQSPPKPEWFYMPPSLINTDPGTGKTIDLFAAYNTSYTNSIKSGNLDFSEINPILTTADYDYFVLGYDTTLFANISISPSGVMTYDIIGRAVTDSYITIVFLRK
jgi:hypothetical protein